MIYTFNSPFYIVNKVTYEKYNSIMEQKQVKTQLLNLNLDLPKTSAPSPERSDKKP